MHARAGPLVQALSSSASSQRIALANLLLSEPDAVNAEEGWCYLVKIGPFHGRGNYCALSGRIMAISSFPCHFGRFNVISPF
jgi:hypothetical protein